MAAVLGMLVAATVEGAPNPGFDNGARSLNMALFDYVERNNILALRSIVEAGADITGLNADGRSALDVAIRRGHFEIANYLILSRKMQARGPGNLPAAVPGSRDAPARWRPVFSRLRAARPAPRSPVDVVTTNSFAKLAAAAEKLAQAAAILARVAEAGILDLSGKVAALRALPATRGLSQAQPPATARTHARNAVPGIVLRGRRIAKPTTRPKREPDVAFAPTRKPEPPREPSPGRQLAGGDERSAPAEANGARTKRTGPTPSAPTIQKARTARAAAPPAAPEKSPRRKTSDRKPGKRKNITQTRPRSANPFAPGNVAPGAFFPGLESLARPGSKTYAERPRSKRGVLRKKVRKKARKKAMRGAPRKTARAEKRRPSKRLARRSKTRPRPRPKPPLEAELETAKRGAAVAEKETPGFLQSLKDIFLPGRDVPKSLRRQVARAAEKRKARALSKLRPRQTQIERQADALNGVDLTLGQSVRAGARKPRHGTDAASACVSKRRQMASFCIVEVDWPDEIRDAFAVNTILYQGTRAIARYDRGRANSYHALFDTEAFDAVLAYAKRRFGKPTGFWRRTIAPFAKPRQPNPTHIWRSRDPETNRTTILEIRKFDDARKVFPDTKHGAIRL